ncbi:hypothetical protein GF345_03000 [Candidatus Woesearchaeota archaeon]|nr:hypothetical protein [Candidatus Woesearchaeota archaeon]
MVELKLDVKKQNLQVFLDVYDYAKSKKLADENKKKAFGMLSVFDKADNIKMTHSEKRYEPFWHIKGESYIEYLRGNTYGFAVDPQVRSVKIAGKKYEISGDKPYCTVEAEDHCVEVYTKELITDAVEGKQKDKALREYLDFKTKNIKETEDLMGKDKVVIPAKIKAAYLIRGFMKELIKPVQADKVLNETVEIKKRALYFRPVYAFEFTNKRNRKKGAIEVDALTGDVEKGKVYKTELGELVPEGALFDVGAELASFVIPGAALGAEISKVIKKKRDDAKAAKQMKKSRAAMESRSKGKKKKKK